MLRKIDVPTITVEKCQEQFGTNLVTEKTLCIDTTGGHSTCGVRSLAFNILLKK